MAVPGLLQIQPSDGYTAEQKLEFFQRCAIGEGSMEQIIPQELHAEFRKIYLKMMYNPEEWFE